MVSEVDVREDEVSPVENTMVENSPEVESPLEVDDTSVLLDKHLRMHGSDDLEEE